MTRLLRWLCEWGYLSVEHDERGVTFRSGPFTNESGGSRVPRRPWIWVKP